MLFALIRHPVRESRVRENRLHGSEGGAANDRPYVRLKACLIGEVKVLFRHTLSGL